MKYKYSMRMSADNFSSVEEMFKTMHEMGFNAIDFAVGGDFEDAAAENKFCEDSKKYSKIYDVEMYQSHAPIIINKPEEVFLSKEYEERMFSRLKRIAKLGIKNVVAHPYVPEGLDFFRNATPYDYTKLEPHNRELNLEFFGKFIPFLKDEGMTMCIENLFAYDILMQRHVLSAGGNPDELNYYIDNLGDDCFAACYDSGHLNHFGADEYNFITKLGKRLRCVHFNESWGKEFKGMDWHLLPGDGDIDWEKVKKGLIDVDYPGTINAEINPRKGKLFKIQMKYIADSLKALFED